MPHNQGEPVAFTHYPTPGLRLLGTLPGGPIRAIKQVTTGGIYAVSGNGVYSVDPNTWGSTLLGNISSSRTTPVSMQDNGLDLVIVDGSTYGWDVTLATNAFSIINDPNGMMVGADRVDYLDTYLLFNKPNTPQFYSSDSLAVTFDQLWFANKESFSDLLVTLAVAKREIWLLGERTSEIWYNAGSTDFPFQQMQSTFVDHGCRAKYSVATYDNMVFWLAYDRAGQGLVLYGIGYQTTRVSTYAIEAELTTYSRIDDAIGFTYSLGGHVFYVLTFPTADVTWVYDITTKEWHEWRWIDSNGDEHRHRANCAYPINGQVVVGDWENGNLYALDPSVMTDNGWPIKRQRAYPHILNDLDRVFYRQFEADLETGTHGSTTLAMTLVQCSFTAPDATPVENYSNPLEAGLPWVPIAGHAAIYAGQMVGYGDGFAVYQATMEPVTADYIVQFSVVPTVYDMVIESTVVFVIGRANGTAAGYQAQVTSLSHGTGYVAGLIALGVGTNAQVILGTIPSGAYRLTLSMESAAISLSIQRTWDGQFIRSDGAWQPEQTVALSLTDSTWAAGGTVIIGGDWGLQPAERIGLEDASGAWAAEDGSGAWLWEATGGSAGYWGPIDVGLEDASGQWALQDGSGDWLWQVAGAEPPLLALDDISVVTIPAPDLIFLDWSDDRGHTYGNRVQQSLGGLGEYLTICQWQRLGYARDRVFRLTWSTPTPTALQGAFIQADTSAKT
jgi:hypothetical protein